MRFTKAARLFAEQLTPEQRSALAPTGRRGDVTVADVRAVLRTEMNPPRKESTMADQQGVPGNKAGDMSYEVYRMVNPNQERLSLVIQADALSADELKTKAEAIGVYGSTKAEIVEKLRGQPGTTTDTGE